MQSEKIDLLAAALCKAQAEIKGAEKDGTNPHYKSDYSTLEAVIKACRDALAKQGLSVSQILDHNERGAALITRLIHTSGQWIQGSCPLILGQRQDMQALGSAITYARRYSLAAIVGVVAEEDDDAEGAIGRSAGVASGQAPAKPIGKAPVSNQYPGDFVFDFGKFRGRKVSAIPESDLRSYANYLRDSDSKNPSDRTKAVIETIENFLAINEDVPF